MAHLHELGAGPRRPKARTARIAALLCAVAALWAGRAAEAADTRVVLVVHPVVNVPDAESRAIANDLAAAMSKRFDARVFTAERGKLPANLPEDCVSDMSCTGDLADRLAADQVLYLVMVRVGTKVQVDATWVDPQSGRSMPRDTFEVDAAPEGRAAIAQEMAPAMIPRGEVPLAGQGGAKTSPRTQPASTPPAVRAAADADDDDRRGALSGVTLAAWGSTGVATLAIGTGLALVLSGIGEYDALLDECGNTARARARCADDLDRFGTRSTVATVMLVGGGLAGAMAVALFATDEDGLAQLPTPSIGADGFGLAWRARF